jgi:hypothetical protein
MSSPIWTPDALLSETKPYSGRAWRLVEAQHIVSTIKLTGNLAEQEELEAILDESQPPAPAEFRVLSQPLSKGGTRLLIGHTYPASSAKSWNGVRSSLAT